MTAPTLEPDRANLELNLTGDAHADALAQASGGAGLAGVHSWGASIGAAWLEGIRKGMKDAQPTIAAAVEKMYRDLRPFLLYQAVVRGLSRRQKVRIWVRRRFRWH